MGLFDIFKKGKKYELPEMYNGIVNKDEYNVIIDASIQYHKDNGLEVSKIEEGELVIELNGEEQHRYLDNLVRLLASNDKSIWKDLIYEHFEKLKDNSSAYKYLFKDFEYAQHFLRVLIKPEDLNFGDSVSDYVHRTDFPKTFTFLVLEFEDQFRYIRKEDITEWNKPEDELFEIAILNIPDKEIELKEYQYYDKFTVYIFFSGDYSSALMLDLKKRADYSIGTYGSLVAIPTKGTAFTHPIETGDILELVESLYPSIEQFYNEDPGCITTNFYWFYNEMFEVFPLGQDDNGTYVRLPEELESLIKQQK